MRLIGFTGPSQSGKTRAATALYTSDRKRYTVGSFAWPVKQMLLAGLGLDPQAKADILPVAGHTGRHLMQTLGTEWGRNMIHPDLWVRVFQQRYDREERIVLVDDVRFPNEADLIRRHGALVHLPGAWSASHASETGVPVADGDYIADDLTIETLTTIARLVWPQ